jgi:hypothetical protein
MSDSGIADRINKIMGGVTIFGVLLPGALLLSGLYLHNRLFQGDPQTATPNLACYYTSVAHPVTEAMTPTGAGIVAFGALSLMTLILGHVASALSTIFIDRGLIDRVNYYPFVALLCPELRIKLRSALKRQYYKAVFMVLVISTGLSCAYGFSVAGVLGTVAVVAVILRCNTWMRSAISERKPVKLPQNIHRLRWWVWCDVVRRVWYHARKAERGRDRILRTGIACLQMPVILFVYAATIIYRAGEKLLLSPFGINEPLPGPLRSLFVARFRVRFGEKPDGWKTDVFWLPLLDDVRRYGEFRGPIERILQLYTLAQNMCMAFCMLLWYGIVCFWLIGDGCDAFAAVYRMWCGITILGSVVFFMSYYNLYYGLFTKLVLRVFALPDLTEAPAVAGVPKGAAEKVAGGTTYSPDQAAKPRKRSIVVPFGYDPGE